jgi:NhaA family Na+:H+ antiporter
VSLSKPPLGFSWVAGKGPVARLVARPLRRFLDTEAASGAVLLVATVAALVWANSPWSAAYDSLWHTEAGFSIGSLDVTEDLRHWVNDGLMALFFLVVGLEIKRELVSGELNDFRKAAVPVVAAIGGMIVPAAIYLAFNVGEASSHGWGIPMATDIAFAVGVLALVGRSLPSGLRVFLLSLAIVDDIGAILVIALFYTANISIPWLALAVGGIGFSVFLRSMKVWWTPIYVVIGMVIWFATFESGVHATIAGVVLGLLAPARPADSGGAQDVFVEAQKFADEPSAEEIRSLTIQAQETVSVAERIGSLLHPYTSFIVIPLFAFANAGLVIDPDTIGDALSSQVALGVVLGLVIGKLVGVSLFSWFAVRSGLGTLPEDATWPQMFGVAALAGLGFTVSLFISGLAFDDPTFADQSKLGILVGSILAAIVGTVLIRMSARSTAE